MDIYLISEGTHRALWQVLGAHPRQLDGVDGVGFAVWAPNAQGVSVVGDFCRWDERRLPDAATRRLRRVRAVRARGVAPARSTSTASSARAGELRLKADPFAQAMELPPSTASRVDRLLLPVG